jgi:RES domain
MSAFESWYAYGLFADRIRREARHLLDPTSTRFLKALSRTSLKRERTIKKGELFWRAQLGHDWKPDIFEHLHVQVAIPYSENRMTPLRDRATEGRVNAKGIPCLYLSTDRETAMSEVRPWIGSGLTVAQFRMRKDVRVVDCSRDEDDRFVDSKSDETGRHDAMSDPKNWEGAVWSGINRSFSLPVSPSDNVADYAPTQVLAEAFREYGFGGIVYKSALGRSMNVALFDAMLAGVVKRFMFKVSSVQFSFEAIPTPPNKRRKAR